MKHKILLSLFSAAMLTAGGAYAGGGNLLGGEGGGNMAEGAMYGGASYGQGTTNCLMSDILSKEEDCKTPGWKVYGGYKITDMIGVEGGYYNLGTSEQSFDGSFVEDGVTVTNPVAEGTATGLGLSAIGSLPVMDNLEVFGKAGVMRWTSEGTTTATGSVGSATKTITGKETISGTSLLLGAGASYKIDENWGVRGEYERFTRKDIREKEHNVDVMSAGVTYSTL